ncbi:hypothetical protein [uncultured Ramlibacter sp.]|uniref:hypothetical protein n=1 Tax=uncultured Ramlibacter sp. TaxID=260755 RepID=UPI00261D4A6C|nr:hypothetical protein [uncultured Ramlibacter sp.]
MKKYQSIALCASMLAVTAASWAAGNEGLSQAQQRYNQERSRCMSGQSHQDRATCLQEAGAALQESQRGGLATDKANLAGNATARCDAQPVADRADCMARIQGAGTAQGSVEGGGLIRQTETPVK